MSPPSLPPSALGRALLGGGDPGRLRRVLAKARRGEPVTLGVIGGSITAGARASLTEHSYPAHVLAWWRRRFPTCAFRLVNAGIGGTGSVYGALRAGDDLLVHRPDLVIVEFAVNDAWNDDEPFEGLVRQILAQPHSPAVVLLFMMWRGGGNSQAMQQKIGGHYGLPMVSFRDAVWPEIAAGRLAWSDLMADDAHPNDDGHALTGALLARLFESALQGNSAAAAEVPGALPQPLHSDLFQFVDWRDAARLGLIGHDGWTRTMIGDGQVAWVAPRGGGCASFAFSGTGVVAALTGPVGDLASLHVRIDGREASLQVSQKSRFPVLARGLPPGPHRIDITLARAPGQGQSEPPGLIGLGGIGARPR